MSFQGSGPTSLARSFPSHLGLSRKVDFVLAASVTDIRSASLLWSVFSVDSSTRFRLFPSYSPGGFQLTALAATLDHLRVRRLILAFQATYRSLTIPSAQPSGSFVSLLAVVLALCPAGSYLTSFPRRWSGFWADASASSLVVSSLESPFDFSGLSRHLFRNRFLNCTSVSLPVSLWNQSLYVFAVDS
jgi:hypothetical protein